MKTKTNSIIYWAATGILALMMLFSAFSYLTNPQIAASFKHLGFLDYFRIELGIAKIIGAIVLLVPQIPERMKEWAYAGFGIVFISAAIAHISSDDSIGKIMMPLIFLIILIFSNVYMHKMSKGYHIIGKI
ncbi:MAG: DoxX family protein [Bacteroidetes bacterium]|nr:DoxX family protein [Bacteroidota bacterium]